MTSMPVRPSSRLCAASLLLATFACRPEPAPTQTPSSAAADAAPAVPDDAYAVAGGVAIPRLAFDEALAKLSASGPSSRDDSGLRQRVGLALVTRELVRLELARLGATDAAELDKRSLPLLAAVARVQTASTPTWWSTPPLVGEDLAAAVVVAAELSAAPIDDAALAAAYEQQKARWSSEQPWLRLDVWTLRFDDAVGIDECDAYIAKYRRCTEKFPAATRPNVLADLSRQANEWRAHVDDAEWAKQLANECAAAESEALAQTSSMGCDWSSAADGAERKATAARKAELRRVAESVRARIADGEDPLVVAAQLGGTAQPRQMLAADELAKAVLKATRGLGVGKTSKLVDDGHAWTIVRLHERHDAGTLPVEAVKEDLADDVRARKLAEALEQLPATLRGKYPVELHPSFESLDSGP